MKWPEIALGAVIRHRSDFFTIDDLTEYKRCRVQLHAKGIVLRDLVPGAMVKTKKQQTCRAGELLVAEIDAKVGGYGLVPPELDGAIVSSHYFLYEVDETQLDREWLGYFIQTPAFAEQVGAQGSTNYAAIRPKHVLDYKIPLPPLSEQRRLVAKIQVAASKVDKATQLREEVTTLAQSLSISLHEHLAGGRTRTLRELVALHEDQVMIETFGTYPQVGVRSFGGGLFGKDAVQGTQTSYRVFNRLYEGGLVMSQVKGWEGAIAGVPADLDGWFVSPEYRTFRCIPGEAIPEYLAAICMHEWFWGRLAGEATKGVGARRERTRPERFLDLRITMPTLQNQEKALASIRAVRAASQLAIECSKKLDALLPSILHRAFRGEL